MNVGHGGRLLKFPQVTLLENSHQVQQVHWPLFMGGKNKWQEAIRIISAIQYSLISAK